MIARVELVAPPEHPCSVEEKAAVEDLIRRDYGARAGGS